MTPKQQPQTAPDLEQGLADLGRLRQFSGPANEFWPLYLAALQHLTLADKFILLARKPDQPWRRVMEWPAVSPPAKMFAAFFTQLETLAAQAVETGGVMARLEPKASAPSTNFTLAVHLDMPGPEQCVLAALLSEVTEPSARQAALTLRVAAHWPGVYQTNLALGQARADVERVASALDLALSVNEGKRFLATALAFCNGLATRFNCDRVSLGWLERGYTRLKAISRTEKFERQMLVAQAIETAMDEALDQDDEVVWPAADGAAALSRDHECFASEQKVPYLCSLPLRSNHEPVAVVFCERRSAPFSVIELQQMRLGCDLAAARLADLHERDRWFGARWAVVGRERLARLIGPEHTWAKLLALLGVLFLAALFVVRVPYRVEGNFVLRSDDLAYLSAPFEGYIDEVFARPGDAVTAGAPLLKLKTSELLLQESAVAADLKRFQREAEKARAANALAEMRIAEAMAEQAAARLDLVRFRIGSATITAPWAGVVVEGDLRERLGAPVKTAEVLFKVARIDTLYAEAEVNERDVHEILGKSTGQIAFVSRPAMRFPVRITTVEQAALPKNDANVFLVRCALGAKPQSWWRPGMSGICKFAVEKRTLIWILTHRTVDFLRLKLWW